MMTWVSADMRTGAIIADLPGFECDWPLRRTLGTYDTATGRFYLDGAPPNWQYALREGGALLAVYDDTDPSMTVQWAGYVTQQTRDTANGYVAISLSTLEGYFDRRYVADLYDGTEATPQDQIAWRLVDSFVGDGMGVPFLINDLAEDGGTLRVRSYLESDNATVYTRLVELMAVDGGPEFTVDVGFTADRRHLLPTFVVGPRIGTAKPADLPSPMAVFEMPGAVTQAAQVRDYSNGKGANLVVAYSSGQGDDLPIAAPTRAPDDGRPTFEYKWSPSSSITDAGTLADYARRAVAVLAPGARAMTLVADLNDAPRYGTDWRIGDDIGYQLGGLDETGRDTVPLFPGGLSGVGRCIAYEITDTTITPILAETGIPSADDSDTAGGNG